MSAPNVWQIDRNACSAPASLTLSGADLQLFRDFVAEAEPALQRIATTTGAPSIDAEDVDRDYRALHFILGFSRVWGIDKVVETLKAAEFAFDACRGDRNFERGSMDYVIRLSIGAAIIIFRNMIDKGVCETDVCDSVEECARYIRALEEADRLARRAVAAKQAVEDGRESVSSTHVTDGSEGQTVFEDFVEEPSSTVDQSPLTNEFCAEARDNLARAASRLIDLENSPDDPEIVNE
jgi:chemotaxis protein histidine kinase CheA